MGNDEVCDQSTIEVRTLRIISKKSLVDFWNLPGRQDSEDALKAWHEIAKSAVWRSPSDVKAQYRNCSLVGDNRVVFNIKGNSYRLIVKINYRAREPIAFIRFVGTHLEYDHINAEEV